MKKNLLLLIVLVLSTTFIRADEGMWLPHLVEKLNYEEMQKMGLQLTAEEIYSINNGSLKDATVALNKGMCTGVMVSGEGLMLTNHHCALAYIQENTIKYNKDFIHNGFWALDKKQELYNPNLTATFLVRIEDVTQKILAQVTNAMKESDRQKIVDKVSKEIAAEATKGTHYEGEVKSFYEGNEYYLFIYETYSDVRLVGAPPISIGNFGADSDNWLWPRHTADFCFLRVYTGPDGKPARYDKRKNIPMIPKHFVPVSTKGMKEDDFAMVLGYPGTTNRFMTSYGVKLQLEKINPTIVSIRDAKLRLLKEQMEENELVELQYRSKYNRSSNYWKYYIGQTEILIRILAYDLKKDIEEDFMKWINNDTQRKEKYKDALSIIEEANKEIEKYVLSKYYFREAVLRGPEIINYANQFDSLYYYLNSPDGISKEDANIKVANLSTKLKYYSSNYYFKSYNAEVDKKIFIELMRMFYDNVPKEQHPGIFQEVEKKYKTNFSKYAQDLFDKSIFSSKEQVYTFLMDPKAKTIEKDPAYIAMKSFYNKYEEIDKQITDAELKKQKGKRLFIEGLLEMQGNKAYYPDANSTMRLTYGKVVNYEPTDGDVLPYFTTFDELIKRENPKKEEFTVLPGLKSLYEKKDYGKYVDENGKIRVCFLTNNDVTGGNSGAGMLNAKGELVGMVFDINWEATAASVKFVPGQQRTISTDIRYVLFITDKYAGAQNIIDELEIH